MSKKETLDELIKRDELLVLPDKALWHPDEQSLIHEIISAAKNQNLNITVYKFTPWRHYSLCRQGLSDIEDTTKTGGVLKKIVNTVRTEIELFVIAAISGTYRSITGTVWEYDFTSNEITVGNRLHKYIAKKTWADGIEPEIFPYLLVLQRMWYNHLADKGVVGKSMVDITNASILPQLEDSQHVDKPYLLRLQKAYLEKLKTKVD